MLWKTHLLAFDSAHLHGFTAWKYGLAWLLMFIFTGIFEESLLRGYLQYTLTRGIGFWWGALLMSILFGAIHGHNQGESPVGLFSAGAVGLVFCISLWYTGSLWWAIGFHAAWDWAQTFFYGTPDSGMVARGHFLNGASDRAAAVERRPHRPGGQPLHRAPALDHGACHVAMVASQTGGRRPTISTRNYLLRCFRFLADA